ncbi:hypothetical protein PQQ96_06005 [Paraburkholderia sediminicola]|uniref:hypothetical protein n=1 Tax=Paraburkholderia sediminicola TaxID=458836 RepID=UPI0038BD56CC
MQNIGTTLTPGTATPFQQKGKVLQVLSSGNSAGLTVQFLKGSQVAYTVNGVLGGYKLTPEGGFDSLTIASATGDTISAIVTGGDVDIQILSNASVITNTSADPVPVNIAGGTVNVTASNITVANTTAQPVPVQLQTDAEATPMPVSVSGTANVSGSVSIANGVGSPVPVYDAYQAPVTAAWTSATALNTAETVNTQGYDTVIFTVAPSGTITAGAITFEVYDGTNWISLKAPRTDSYLTDTTFALAGAGIHSWQLPVAGYPQVRARLSTVIAGSGTASLVAIASSAPDVSLVTVGLDPNQPLPAGTNSIGAVTLGTGSNTIGAITDNTQQVRSVAGKSFSAGYSSGSAASQYSRIQLWNPAGSGVNLYVQQVSTYDVGATAISVPLLLNSTQATTLVGQGMSKLAGGAAAQGQIRTDTTATASPAFTLGVTALSGAGVTSNYPSADPIVIPPGYGLTMEASVVNYDIGGMFEWYEQ